VFKFLLALHLLFAIFAIGPLVHAATTASRGVRHADADATAMSLRMCRVYSIASVLVVLAGGALMGVDSPFRKGEKVAEFGDTYIWLSLLLWLVSVGIVQAVAVPALSKAGRMIAEQQPVRSLTPRVAAAGGLVGVLFAVIVFLMVYRPGS
jgi:hypothetical protein